MTSEQLMIELEVMGISGIRVNYHFPLENPHTWPDDSRKRVWQVRACVDKREIRAQGATVTEALHKFANLVIEHFESRAEACQRRAKEARKRLS